VNALRERAPGVLFCIGLAVLAVFVAENPWVKSHLRVSPLLIVILVGMVIASSLTLPATLRPGVAYCQKPVLRLGVALLGIKLSLAQIGQIGASAVAVVLAVTAVGFGVAILVGRWLKMGEKPTLLLATGGSICGASAIVAADSVLQSEGKDAAVSLAVVTFWGTVGILVYPLIETAFLHMTGFSYGVFCGATLHEVAQVVAGAANFAGPDAPHAQLVATVIKLTRVAMLAPMIIGLGWWMRRTQPEATAQRAALVPWFLWAFVALATLRSFAPQIGLESTLKSIGDQVVPLVLSVGMAGVGLHTRLKEVVQAGWAPVVLGLIQWIVMIVVCLALMRLFGV
jgi:uncharacterized integral membrane protein (TIGR00698 family)